jgi:hypothetical protein
MTVLGGYSLAFHSLRSRLGQTVFPTIVQHQHILPMHAAYCIVVASAQAAAGEHADLLLSTLGVALGSGPYLAMYLTAGPQIPTLRRERKSQGRWNLLCQYGRCLLEHQALAIWAGVLLFFRIIGARIDLAVAAVVVVSLVSAIVARLLFVGPQVPPLRDKHME